MWVHHFQAQVSSFKNSSPWGHRPGWFVFFQVPDVRQAIVRVNSKEKPKASAASSRKGTGYITKAGPVASDASVWAFGGPDNSGGAGRAVQPLVSQASPKRGKSPSLKRRSDS